MNLFPGLVSATSDLGLVDAIFKNVISHKAPATKFIFLGDPLGYDTIIQSYDMINGLILVPDYITLSYLINGDYLMFQKSYIDLLRRPSAEQFFATLLCVLNRNNNIIFYIPESCKDIGYAEFLNLYGADDMKRVLCLVSSMDSGGAETFLMKIYWALSLLYSEIDRLRMPMISGSQCSNILSFLLRVEW